MTIAELVAVARSRSDVVVTVPETVNLHAVIRGVRPDRTAGQNDLTWISPAVASKDPARVLATRAGVVVVPYERPVPSGAVGLHAHDPRRVFAELVTQCFVDSTDCPWPHVGPFAPGVVIGGHVALGDHVTIGPNTCIANATIGRNVRIGANCTIGNTGFGFFTDASGQLVRFPHLGRVIIEDDVEIGNNTCIDRGALGDTVIRRGAKIDNLVHIAHNCEIGEGALVIAGAVLCGGTVVGDGAQVAPNATTREQIHVGARSVIGLGAVVVKDVADGTTVIGNPAKPYRKDVP